MWIGGICTNINEIRNLNDYLLIHDTGAISMSNKVEFKDWLLLKIFEDNLLLGVDVCGLKDIEPTECSSPPYLCKNF